ncbi:MAG: cobalamin B12-binding domain-containing protein [Nitrospirae bacterium]|nr:cobalamin B12-binding domain-containing protein [Nitrospirota bacterium]
MRVLLISPNRETLPDPVFPIGLAYIASALKEAGHEISVVDLCFTDDIEKTLQSGIFKFKPELIGISIRNIDDVSFPRSISYLPLYRITIDICRKYSDVPIVAGGSGFTILPQEFMETLNIEYGIIGEGESQLLKLIDYLQNGGDLPDSVITTHKPHGIPKTDFRWKNIIPLRNIFSIKDYYEKGGMLNIQTRRGCPFRCIYCSYPLIEGRDIRFREISHVIDEISGIVEQTGVRHFFIVDSIFNHPREYALAFCNEIIKRGLKLSWNCYANPGLMDKELIGAMLRAGCSGVEFGTDSMIDSVLDNLKKGFRYKQVQEVSQLCKQAGLKFCHFCFIGAPGETTDDIKLNIDRLSSLNADSTMLMVGIRIFPNTELFLRAKNELGIHKIGLEPVYYISPYIEENIENIVHEISEEHKDWIFPGFEINYHERLQRLLRKSGIKGSLWEELSKR